MSPLATIFLFLHVLGAIAAFGPSFVFPIIARQSRQMPTMAMFGLKLTDTIPDGTSAQENAAVVSQKGSKRAPDVLDVDHPRHGEQIEQPEQERGEQGEPRDVAPPGRRGRIALGHADAILP